MCIVMEISLVQCCVWSGRSMDKIMEQVNEERDGFLVGFVSFADFSLGTMRSLTM